MIVQKAEGEDKTLSRSFRSPRHQQNCQGKQQQKVLKIFSGCHSLTCQPGLPGPSGPAGMDGFPGEVKT